MTAIKSIKSNEYSFQRQKDKYRVIEEKSKTLLKQIFWKYGYDPIKFHNPMDGTYYGIDDVILKDDIPDDDPFNLSKLVKGRFSDLNYAIDYKSNTFDSNDNYDRGLNSVYIKLMPYRGIKEYLPYSKFNGERIKTVTKNQLKDDKQRKMEAKRDPKFRKKVTLMEKYYGNHYLLGDDNKTDYFFYVKDNRITDNINSDMELELVSAYLVPAEQLRNQVINILNAILKKGGYNYPIKLREDGLYLNHKIRNALKICEESSGLIKPEILKPPMDLFIRHKNRYNPEKDEIILRIHEKYLTPHIKFNSEGDIIK